MASISNKERLEKIAHAKRLYVKGFDLNTIADMLGFSVNTLNKWASDNDFESAKRATSISINEVRNEILLTYQAMQKGEEPKMSPDQISKLVSSLEKLSYSQKSISWIIEGYELLTETFLEEVQASKSEKQKEKIYELLKEVRKRMDTAINKLQKELL